MKARFLALAALLFGLAACQTDPQDLDVNVGGEQEVMLTVSLPETTRANSAQGFDLTALGSNYDIRYILEIYRVENDVVLYDNCQRFVETSDGTSMVFPVRLAPGYDYRIVAWADIVEDGSKADRYYYTEEGLDNVVIKDNGTVNWNAMDETRDAYTCVKVVNNFSSASNLDMTLTRPFAKVRVVATDIEDIRNVGLEPTTATVEYVQNMYVKYNAVEDKRIADGAKMKEHEFAYDDVATEYNDATGELTLFTDYIFVPSTGTAKFSLNVYADASKSMLIKSNNFNTEIFVERNMLTTIKGDVLTIGGDVKVTVEKDFENAENPNDKPYYIEYKEASSAQELVNIIDEINNSTTNEQTHISLTGNIDLNDLLNLTRASSSASITIPAGKEVVLDIKNYTITGTDKETASFGMFNIQPDAKLTIEGTTGKIQLTAENNRGWNAYSSVISNQRGEFVLNGGTIEHLGGTDMAYGLDILTNTGAGDAKATINGGVVKSTYRAVRLFLNSTKATAEFVVNGGTIDGRNNKSIWMQNANASVNPGKLVVAENANLYGDVMISGNNAPELAIELSLANAALKDEATVVPSNIPIGYSVVEENGVWVVKFTPVAKIGEKGYATLAKAVAAVEDGGTITLVANEVFTETNRYNNGGWWDGLGYSGDKSFTLDLNGYTISQNGALNDYLLWFKNVGSKANTITIKNGTLDAGTTAFCALCTASSHDNQLTINLENVNLINNNSNGSTIKVRAGSVVNVNAGSKITGKNSYLGIENWNATVNVYDGAEIYMNGTSSYNGCLIGVGGNGTVNVYGGYGKGVSGGLIAMTSGGTINVSGGEWIANTDGTYANSNKSVLIAQSDKQYNAGAGNAVVNVTGGTFKGGYNCYGNAVGDAQINIKGGNFNADPASYVVDGYKVVEANGIYTVVVDPVAKIGSTDYATLQEAFNVGGDITLLRDVTVAETVVLAAGTTVVLDLNGKTLSAVDMNTIKNNGGNLTIKNGTVTRTGDVVGYSVNNASGEIAVENATIECGLYTSGSKMTATNANISHEQSSRHAIYAWNCAVTINSGTFHNDNAGNATLMASGSSVVTINGGTFSIADGRSSLGWTSSMIDQNSTAQVIVKGGLFNGGFRINSTTTTLTIEGGEFNTNNGSAFTDYSGTKVVKGGKFTDAGAQNWAKKYIAEGYEMNANGEVVAK